VFLYKNKLFMNYFDKFLIKIDFISKIYNFMIQKSTKKKTNTGIKVII